MNKAEITCPKCGCNHMYIAAYEERPDVVPLSEASEIVPGQVYEYPEEDPYGSTRMVGYLMLTMIIFAILALAWIIWR